MHSPWLPIWIIGAPLILAVVERFLSRGRAR
jgi:hypothetical protein